MSSLPAAREHATSLRASLCSTEGGCTSWYLSREGAAGGGGAFEKMNLFMFILLID